MFDAPDERSAVTTIDIAIKVSISMVTTGHLHPEFLQQGTGSIMCRTVFFVLIGRICRVDVAVCIASQRSSTAFPIGEQRNRQTTTDFCRPRVTHVLGRSHSQPMSRKDGNVRCLIAVPIRSAPETVPIGTDLEMDGTRRRPQHQQQSEVSEGAAAPLHRRTE